MNPADLQLRGLDAGLVHVHVLRGAGGTHEGGMGSVPGGGVIGETSGLPPEGGGQALETGVIRRAFRMAVTPGRETEYIRRHQPIWPELEATLLAYGVRTYSIFLDAATSTLFAYVEFDSVERWEAVARTDVCQQWWAHMRELMPCNPDNSPVTSPLDEVFHIGR